MSINRLQPTAARRIMRPPRLKRQRYAALHAGCYRSCSVNFGLDGAAVSGPFCLCAEVCWRHYVLDEVIKCRGTAGKN